jgi:DNA-binding transcriptional regulator YhcF (GntR family)
MKVNFSHSRSKKKAIADAISKAIINGDLQVNDNLLSINEASSKYKVSRDTVFKAYIDLKKLGMIDSNPQKGYFVKDEINHVLLLLDTYSSFKQNLYDRFIENIPESYKVDLIFHQYNERLFETIVRESAGKYSMYVVMNFSNEKLSETLKLIPAQKLLLLDFGNFDKTGYSYICQDFGEAFFSALLKANELLKKYAKLAFVFPEANCHPIEATIFFEKFCNAAGFEYEIIRRKSDWKGVEARTAYICITNEDLVKIIKETELKGLSIGKDIGLVRYNNEPILEIIKNGISSISIDFGLMGEKAARFVTSKKSIREYLPTDFIIRDSL